MYDVIESCAFSDNRKTRKTVEKRLIIMVQEQRDRCGRAANTTVMADSIRLKQSFLNTDASLLSRE